MAKIAVIGAGHVGSHVALECARLHLAEEIVLLDADREKAWAQAADIADAGVAARVFAGGYDAVSDADIAVMAACKNGYESSDRLLELPHAAEVARDVADGLAGCGFSGIVVSITNPCDVISQLIAARTGLRVVGTGTLFDSARFRIRIARALGVDAGRVSGYCLGEHGDSQVPAASTVRVDGRPLAALSKDIDFVSLLCQKVNMLDSFRDSKSFLYL
jgi:L-lactate dehydrogenase